MKNNKKRLVESIQYEIEAKEKLLEKLEKIPVGLISECFPNGRWSLFWSSGFEFSLPFDFELIGHVRSFMADQFPEINLLRENQFVWDTSKSAGHFLEYETQEENRSDRAWFQIAFRTEREGTTCVLNKIGEKSIPVFEVICSDGAKEGLS